MERVFIIMALFISISGINCNRNSDKSSDFDKIQITQPNALYLDTSSCYYKYIKEYIKSDPDQGNSYLLAIYYSDDEHVKTKIAAFKPADATDFNFRIPSSLFRLYGKNVFVLNGMDFISVPDKDYIKKINEQMNTERNFDSLPSPWEIIYDFDTCYYKKSNLSLIPVPTKRQIKGTIFIKPEH